MSSIPGPGGSHLLWCRNHWAPALEPVLRNTETPRQGEAWVLHLEGDPSSLQPEEVHTQLQRPRTAKHKHIKFKKIPGDWQGITDYFSFYFSLNVSSLPSHPPSLPSFLPFPELNSEPFFLEALVHSWKFKPCGTSGDGSPEIQEGDFFSLNGKFDTLMSCDHRRSLDSQAKMSWCWGSGGTRSGLCDSSWGLFGNKLPAVFSLRSSYRSVPCNLALPWGHLFLPFLRA